MVCKKAKKHSELRREVGVLAKHIGHAIKSAAHSREVSDIRSEIKQSVRCIGDRVAKAVKKASASPALGEIKGQTKKVMSLSKKEGLKAAANLRQNLAVGIGAAANELQRLAAKLRKKG